MAGETPRTTGTWQRSIIDESESETPTLRMQRRATTTHRSAQAARNARAGEAMASTRSSYRRSSSRYTAKGRRTKKILIRLAIALGAVLALGGIALGVANWTGIIKPDVPGGEDPTIIPLRQKGKEADLPVVNVDTLIAGLAEIDGTEDSLVVFSTTKKDFTIDDGMRAALEAAILQAQAALPAVAQPAAEEPTEGEATAEGEGEGEAAAEAEASAEEEAEPTFSTSNITFFAMDLEQGHGVAYNLDDYVQGGQAIKGLFATYFASQFLDTAKATPEAEGVEVASCLDDNQDALYERLRKTYDSLGWDAWIGGVGAKSCVASAGYYPMLSNRMDTRAWLNVYRYLTGGTYGATWLGEQIEAGKDSLSVKALTTGHAVEGDGETIVIEPVACEMTIWAYGGHRNSPGKEEYCLVENAIVLAQGHSYLICVLTGLPDTGGNRELLEDLIAACANAVIHVEAPAPAEEAVEESQA